MSKKSKKLWLSGILTLTIASLMISPLVTAHSEGSEGNDGSGDYGCVKGEPLCVAWLFSYPAERTADLQVPKYDAPAKPAIDRVVNYHVETRGVLSADLEEFKTLSSQTLNDPRGWVKMGISFKEVETGGDFTLVLAEAAQVAAFSPGCSAEYSCNVGRYVIINQDRWLGATPAWNSGGGSLRDYRHMVVNHETGHWLGHGHRNCGGAGQPAPVMQQQSIDLQGCVFNPWPTKAELYSPRLGI